MIPNKAAQEERLTEPDHMRVPVASVIHRLFDAEPLSYGDGMEDLSQWESQGKPLDGRAVVRGGPQGCRPGNRHRAAGGLDYGKPQCSRHDQDTVRNVTPPKRRKGRPTSKS